MRDDLQRCSHDGCERSSAPERKRSHAWKEVVIHQSVRRGEPTTENLRPSTISGLICKRLHRRGKMSSFRRKEIEYTMFSQHEEMMNDEQ
jgi:hypothetical protein